MDLTRPTVQVENTRLKNPTPCLAKKRTATFPITLTRQTAPTTTCVRENVNITCHVQATLCSTPKRTFAIGQKTSKPVCTTHRRRPLLNRVRRKGVHMTAGS
uniref:Uncharacterized protein n=1 Tax=Cacopsylla melanoneura TaxID=428564 RepID=A0A8D8X0Z8_9HEMI